MAVNDTAAPDATDVRRHLLVIRLGLMVSVVINVVAGFIVVKVVMLAPIVPPAHHPTVGALAAAVALLVAAASFWWRRRTLTVEALGRRSRRRPGHAVQAGAHRVLGRE